MPKCVFCNGTFSTNEGEFSENNEFVCENCREEAPGTEAKEECPKCGEPLEGLDLAEQCPNCGALLDA